MQDQITQSVPEENDGGYIELKFRAAPDEYGIFDGRLLAHELIGHALLFLLPYSDCQACTVDMFSSLANRTVTQVFEADDLKGLILNITPETAEIQNANFAAHRHATQAVSNALIEEGAKVCCHTGKAE